jgi:ATP-dependent RNA helicase DDX51/DBP6
MRESVATGQTLSAPDSLPMFPLPKRPDAPSKSTLALQGQDRALIQAELVDSRTTSGLEKVGMSERTCKRLKDLGIQELFAGMRICLLTYLKLLICIC